MADKPPKDIVRIIKNDTLLPMDGFKIGTIGEVVDRSITTGKYLIKAEGRQLWYAKHEIELVEQALRTIKEIWDIHWKKNNIFITSHEKVITDSGILGHYKLLNHLGGNIYLCLIVEGARNNLLGIDLTDRVSTMVGDEKKWRVFSEKDWQDIEGSIKEYKTQQGHCDD